MNKLNLRKALPDALVIITFVLISFIYFFTPTIQNKVLIEHDTAAGMGAGQEAKEYFEKHGERTRWTNSLFSGMPTYQISPSYDSTDKLKVVASTYNLGLPKYMALNFIMLIGFYILLRSFKVSPLISGLGAILWAFSSYYFILIVAGHLWKYITLAYIPPTIAGINWAYQKKYLLGGIVAALFASLQILSNHVQMTYYFLFVILFIIIAYFIKAYRSKELPSFYKASGVLLVSALLAVAINSSTLYQTYQFSKESTRGKTELTSTHTAQEDGRAEKEYITQWSYGIDETLTLLIPNYKGGGSVGMASNRDVMEKVRPQYPEVYQYFTQYFGTQPSTVGPVYVGAFVIFLFFMGCFLVKGPIKWALVAATILSILLAWGKNFMPLTELFIDYFPLYNKFRAVSSILVIAEFTIPLLAIFGLIELLKKSFSENKIDNQTSKYLLVSFVLSAGTSLLVGLFPSSTVSGITMTDQYYLNQLPQELAPTIQFNLMEMRKMLVSSDAYRSFFIILIGVAILAIYYYKKINKNVAVVLIALLCLVDLWQVDKRYLNDDKFVEKVTKVFNKTEADKLILEDTDPNYRVLNFTSNTFNENNTSYFHKSIGGYNAAKLRRYQELIERHIHRDMSAFAKGIQSGENVLPNTPILDMLNAKYFILGNDRNGVFFNEEANGNAWFVQHTIIAKSADEEMALLSTLNLKNEAVINSKTIGNQQAISNDYQNTGSIQLTSYEANRIEYISTSNENGYGVFSEIYYPEWKATIDDKVVPIQQVNYVLRGIEIPKGEHKIVFEFKPSSLKATETIAYIGLFILGVLIFISLFRVLVPKEK